MTCNIGKADRIIRLIVGVAIAVLGFYFKSWWGLLALIPLLTAAVGFCPLYVPFKISTVKKKKEGE
jgi:hypothetical protein